MQRQIILTEDGSHTRFIPEMDEHYHSTHGAIQESMHVFIQSGLNIVEKKEITIFEVGFGTGLNALLTLMHKKEDTIIKYITIEKYPLSQEEAQRLNYAGLIAPEHKAEFQKMHESPFNEDIQISDTFSIRKIKADLPSYTFEDIPLFDLIYYDAFAPNKQPQMWDKSIFDRIRAHCNEQAIFVTYCAKGSVRRDLNAAGFNMERIPGPPGKMEMLRGIAD